MRRLSKAIDLLLAATLPKPRTGVAILGFHGLWRRGSTEDGLMDPYQIITPDDLDRLIVRAHAAGLSFICGRDLLANRGRGAIWLTFDDGYANNLDLLPILHRHKVPATVFVTAGAVASGEAFWWDVLHREGRARGTPPLALIRRRESLKALPPDAIRAALIADYGATAFQPVGDSDRPMSPEELTRFSADPLIEIGNHTQNHAILPVLTKPAQREEILSCQQYLTAVTGRTPRIIAYPNGGADNQTLAVAGGCGLEFGVTCLPHRVRPEDLETQGSKLALGRFMGLRHGAVDREARLACGAPGLLQFHARSLRPAPQNAAR